MKIMYDVEHLPERKTGGKESQELLALKAFLAGTQRNMTDIWQSKQHRQSRHWMTQERPMDSWGMKTAFADFPSSPSDNRRYRMNFFLWPKLSCLFRRFNTHRSKTKVLKNSMNFL